MKSAVLFLIAPSFFTALVRGSVVDLATRGTQGDYIQNPTGNATFTVYFGCNGGGACGQIAHGYTAAINQLSFGAAGGEGPGDACGRFFRLTATDDPYSPGAKETFKSIVVKITDLCPGSPGLCGQSRSNPLNQFGASVNFDLCDGSGAASAFFPPNIEALYGYYEEVTYNEWVGYDGEVLWNGACLKGESAPFWGQPDSTGCGNTGEAP